MIPAGLLIRRADGAVPPNRGSVRHSARLREA